ncbi:MAG: peptide chain release factor N(5)-glutamine methyltransferase [Candidatus Stahlbacteria bacterium]|nr:peptide chain release factor N(5)-glutamine methyltransferase [Candidatus Stahlbacteria bacterium]
MLIKDLIREATQILQSKKIDNPIIEAISLVAHGLSMDKSTLYTKYNDQVEISLIPTILSLINRRAKYEPLQYITGTLNFMGLEFLISPPVFIPRPETEMIVEQAIKIAHLFPLPSGSRFGGTNPKTQPSTQIIFDICTGSGVIAITLAKLLPQAFLYATDIIDLKLAKLNATKHGVANRISFIQANLLSPFKKQIPSHLHLRADIIIANPPYIPTAQIRSLQPEIKSFEPLNALDGGNDGMLFIRLLIKQAPLYLKSHNSALLLEIAPEQKTNASKLAKKYFRKVAVLKDFYSKDRILICSF